MMDVLEQPIKMMQKTTTFWQEMASGAPWMKKPETTLMDFWNQWIAGMRSASELNLNAVKVLVENSEEIFFKMFKESQLYSKSIEEQLRENWEALKNTQKAQQKATEDLLGTMENLLKREEIH
jgi:hypothetical protein